MIPIIISSIVVFILVVVLFVFLILTAKEKLLPQKDVAILINGASDAPLIVKPGGTLLTTLASKSIFLASACGGGGTCAMCICQVYSGGGEVLATETNHLNRKQVQDHQRLACQVKVKEDMEIRVPDAVFGVKKWDCTVASNENVSTYIKELVLNLPPGENLKFKSGDYIQVDVPETTIDFKTDLYKIPDKL